MTFPRICAALCAVCALCFTAAAHAAVQAPDFTTAEGYSAACQAMAESGASAATLANDDLRVAFVVCNDTALVKQIVTWASQGMARMSTEKLSQQQVGDEIDKEVGYALDRLAASRSALERIHLGKRKSLHLAPGQWQTDLNGDGKIDTWEKYFFAVPRRGDRPAHFAMPSNDEAYYEREYRQDAAIHVDQSDVLWALSYHDFIESLLNVLRAYRVDAAAFSLTLVRPEAQRRSVELYLQGLDNSEKTRLSVLAETGNDEEWIANPGQTDSAFPIALSAGDFAVWGKVLAELKALAQGKTLLELPRDGKHPASFQFCAKGYGLDSHELLLHPPAHLGGSQINRQRLFGAPYCRKIDARHPLSPLPSLMEDSDNSRLLRYLFWVN